MSSTLIVMTCWSPPATRERARTTIRSAAGELHSVAKQIDDHLADFAGVTRKRTRQLWILVQREFEPLLFRQFPEHQADVIQQHVQVEWLDRECRPARLDLRHFENVVNQRQQVRTAGMDDVDLSFLILVQVPVVFKKLRVAENCVQWRADLMGHVGQEDALGSTCALGGFLGGKQFGRAPLNEGFEVLLMFLQLIDELLAFTLRIDQIRDVPVYPDHAHRSTVRIADGMPHPTDDADHAVRSADSEVGPVLAVAAERGLEVVGGAGEVFRYEAPPPRVIRPAELLLANAVDLVHRVVPHEPVLRDVPVPDAEPRRVKRELQTLFADPQAGFAFLRARALGVFAPRLRRPDRRRMS